MLLGAGHPSSEVLSRRVSPFDFSQRVLHLRHSFKVQNASTDSGDYMFKNFFGARALPRALRAIENVKIRQILLFFAHF